MEVRVEKLDNFGRGIAYINNKICFIEDALPDEIVDINIEKIDKNYQEGKVEKYLKTSPIRIEEECPYSKICGGCNLNHLCYNEENKYKQEKVKSIINKFIKEEILIDNITYDSRDNYRNKITLHGKDKLLGLYKKETNTIIPIKECLLVNPKINEIIKILNIINENITIVTIKTSNDNKESLVHIIGEVKAINPLLNISKVVILNNQYLTKDKYITTSIGNIKYIESKDSFFQINNTLTEKLYNEVKNNINEEDKIILDLYCGTGTIGIYIKDKYKEVTGIDYSESNINDAKRNKELNNIENINLICDKVENKIDEFNDIDVVILDPPRKGLDRKTKEILKRKNIKKIIYVSCDIYTLARDLQELNEVYKIEKVTPFNMFPRTYHCESVCILERK